MIVYNALLCLVQGFLYMTPAFVLENLSLYQIVFPRVYLCSQSCTD